MSKTIIIYISNTGFTKKYVDWITEEIRADVVELGNINKIDWTNYDTVIYGAGIKAGQIKGLNKFYQIYPENTSRRLIVFCSGGAPALESISNRILNENITTKGIKIDSFYYFQSGLNYEKMSFLDRTLMTIYYLGLRLKRRKSESNVGTSNALKKSYDNSCKKQTTDLVYTVLNNQSSSLLLH